MQNAGEIFTAFQQSAIERGAAYVAVGGVVIAIGSLAYSWWQDRQRKLGDKMVGPVTRQLYSMDAIRHSIGRLIKTEVEGLVNTGYLTQECADEVCRGLAFKLGQWELHPKPKPSLAPDPVQVKTAIRIRLNGGTSTLPFPDLHKSPAKKQLRDMLLAALR